MTAVTKNIVIEQGTTSILSGTIYDAEVVDDEVVQGDPKDLTDVEFWMQIRKTQGAAVQFEATVANGKVVVGRESYEDDPGDDDPTNGRFMVIMDDQDTDQLTTKSSLYDFEMIEEDPRFVTRICEGKVTVKANITQHVTGDPDEANDETLET